MLLNRKWAIAAATAILAGALTVQTAFATGSSAHPQWLEQEVQAGRLTQSEADVLKQLIDLRRTRMQQLRVESKAIVDKAVKDGKLTQDQADRMVQRYSHRGPKTRLRLDGMTQEQVKAKLDAAVKSGELTREQADRILQHWTRHQMQTPPQAPSQPQPQMQPRSH